MSTRSRDCHFDIHISILSDAGDSNDGAFNVLIYACESGKGKVSIDAS